MGNFIEEIIENDLSSGRVKDIVTRFPPEPNGYLHIGHAKAICINYYGTAIKYKGKCNLRFDDTNPLKENEDFCNAIVEDLRWMGWTGDIFYASDYFEEMYRAAVLLIEKGKAYIDDISAEMMREMRGTLTEPGKESPRRNRPIAENLALFDDMKNGKYNDGELVLRAKIDMASPNVNMRDPIIYRILKATHHRQGDRWCVYPMYDFAHPIEDAVEGITHSLCSLEFEDHRPLYDWVLTECEYKNPPHQHEFARLNIQRTIMSKRYLKKLVDDGVVDGWDDPRMPTLAGMRRRGYTPTAIREFCERIGVAKANSEVETGQLESCIREELNANAERAMAVFEPLRLEIIDVPNDYLEVLDFDINPNNENGGRRPITLSNTLYIEKTDFMVTPPPKYHRLTVGGMVRLKNAYIVKYESHVTDASGEVTLVRVSIIKNSKSGNDESGVKVKGTIHWVDAKNAVDAEVRLYDYLLNEDDGSKTDFNGRLNQNSLKIVQSKAERRLEEAQKGESFQFLRQGYFCRDIKSNGLVFNLIVGLKSNYNG
ncbi:glutamine-trna ligase [Holotrichia oblita]|nr:glutamine-trna ligase [Holotrichia oblita]